MPNLTTVQDHRQLTEWSKAGGNSTEMPLDMIFNDGHRLSIVVYRHVKFNFFQNNIGRNAK